MPTDGYGYEYNQRQDDDNYFEQPGKCNITIGENIRKISITANAMGGITDHVKQRGVSCHCYKADPEYGKGVAKVH